MLQNKQDQEFSDMASNRLARIVSSLASCVYFCIIIFQLPLFRVPCRFGSCQSPMEVTASQLIATDVFPAGIVKALLYPAAVANAYRSNSEIPKFRNLLKHHRFSNSKGPPAISDVENLEIIAGSYLAVGGAILGLLRSGRMSLFGTLLIAWGFLRETILRNSHEGMQMYPSISLAAFYAFLSIRKDVRRLIQSWKYRRAAKRRRAKAKQS